MHKCFQNFYFNIFIARILLSNVKETNTGSVSFGIGYSSLNNTNFSFGLNEKNFLGEGKKVKLEANISDKRSTYNIGITEPYFKERHLSVYGDIFNERMRTKKVMLNLVLLDLDLD